MDQSRKRDRQTVNNILLVMPSGLKCRRQVFDFPVKLSLKRRRLRPSA